VPSTDIPCRPQTGQRARRVRIRPPLASSVAQNSSAGRRRACTLEPRLKGLPARRYRPRRLRSPVGYACSAPGSRDPRAKRKQPQPSVGFCPDNSVSVHLQALTTITAGVPASRSAATCWGRLERHLVRRSSSCGAPLLLALTVGCGRLRSGRARRPRGRSVSSVSGDGCALKRPLCPPIATDRDGLSPTSRKTTTKSIAYWRRRRDSNPRYALTAYNGLANRRLQPLGHVSVRQGQALSIPARA
jgi:hypothetical protein